MVKKVLVLFLIMTLGLSACGTLKVTVERSPLPDTPVMDFIPTPTKTLGPGPTPTPPVQPLNMDSSPDVIQQKMLRSALNWTTIWLDGVYTDLTVDAKAPVHEQLWIDQASARFRFLSGPVDGNAQTLTVSDGNSKLSMNIDSGARQVSAMPPGIAGQFVPSMTSSASSPNPIGAQIPAWATNMVFSSYWAQFIYGGFKPVEMDKVAGRQALEVDFDNQNSLMWVDVLTGIILKQEWFGEGGGSMVGKYVITKVQYDIPNLPDELFNLNPTSQPAFSDAMGNPLVSITPAPVPSAPAGTDLLGSLYFFTFPQGNTGLAGLVRLPGSCAAGEQACPAAKSLKLPDNTYDNHSLSWAWSPDGKKVALTSDPDSGQTRLFVAALPDLAWKQIALFEYIQMVTWSPDGNWISFGVADSQGWQDFYVIHPDGSGLKNVTATDKLPAEDRPYIADGWMADNLIVHPANPGGTAGVYLLGAEDGQVKPLLDTYPTNATFYPAPDGSLLALNEYDDNNQIHILQVIAPDGSGLHNLAAFKTVIYPIIWSPDGNSLAFAVDMESNPMQAAVYLVGRDGSGLKQVYNSSRVTSLAFSPDGQFLLVAGGDQQQLFVVDLNSLEAHLLQAPGLSLSDPSFLPAWEP